MDLFVERNYVEELRGGSFKKFVELFEANYEALYKYVARRISDGSEVERIVRTTFLDALGKAASTPMDVSYLVWLYGLARPRVWDVMAKGAATAGDDQVSKIMQKMSLEEREILRLKFFEQVTDGDVIEVLGVEEGVVGKKIYRVMKRAHFLLYGESEGKEGVYFGELSGLFEKARNSENIEVPEVLKLNLRADLSSRIERKDFAVEGSVVEEKKSPFVEKVPGERVGSDDPAKVFVEAVKNMSKEEQNEFFANEAREKMERDEKTEEFERHERVFDFIDRWKAVLALVPVVIFVGIFGVILNAFLNGDGLIERGYATTCSIEIDFEGEFSDGERRGVNRGVSDRICDKFMVEKLVIIRSAEGKVDVEVELPDWLLDYEFVKRMEEWRIKKYAKTLVANTSGDEKSG